ncbi:MAG TPA: DMT family transporter [Candidatus Polarisedimenticolia bacterium]|nr:DMT family transporter [Candidatus Polarisedimenticolia bacterium]
MLRDRKVAPGALFALLAAVLWGVGAPLGKMLLAHSGPIMVAALLYIGSGLGLLVLRPLLQPRPAGAGHRHEAPLGRSDVGVGALALLTGGILAPCLLMFGLDRVSAVTGSLLLALEAPFTILIAVALFREHLGWREVGAAVLIVVGAAIVGYQPGEMRTDWIGAAAVAASSLAWAVDSNLSQKLSLRDPVAVIRFKAIGGGLLMLLFSFAAGQRLPGPPMLGLALAIGCVSYGVSAVFWMRALRLLGAARVASYFATAPLLGALAAIPILGERLHRPDLLAMMLMAVGVALLLGERHAHVHVHEEMEHDHAHVHDEHHRHEHRAPHDTGVEPHAHSHRHEPLTHDHPHVSDLHHRHDHD